MPSLLKTRSEMNNAFRVETHYYISKFIPAHTERAHNSSWEEPAQYIRVSVSKDEYDETPASKKAGIENHHIPLSYEEFVSYWQETLENKLRAFSYYDESVATANAAIFAAKQCRYIFDVELEEYRLVNDKFTEMMVKAKRNEREGYNEIIQYLLEKRVILEQKEKEEQEELARVKAEKAEKRRLARIAKMEKELAELKAQ